MAKSKYDDYLEIIMDLHSQGKKATEIANYLNENDENIKAEESGLRAYIKRTLAENEQQEEIEDIEDEENDPSQEEIMHLSELLDKMEEKNSFLQKESVVQGKLLNNLENVKEEYEKIIERHSILNDTMQSNDVYASLNSPIDYNINTALYSTLTMNISVSDPTWYLWRLGFTYSNASTKFCTVNIPSTSGIGNTSWNVHSLNLLTLCENSGWGENVERILLNFDEIDGTVDTNDSIAVEIIELFTTPFRGAEINLGLYDDINNLPLLIVKQDFLSED